MPAPSPLIANRGGRLVLETLDPLPGDRKCFRMINGVLAERTVKDVVPALRTNAEGLKKVLDDLVKQYKTKQDELDKWKVCGEFTVYAVYATVSDLLCRRRTTSRWCSHESAAARTKVRETTPGAVSSLSDPEGVVNMCKSSGGDGILENAL